MKSLAGAFALTLASLTPAFAQANMSCADYLKADAQMQAGMSAADKAALAKDPTAAAMDRKMRAYCQKNPTAPASEAMEKAVMD